MLFPGYAIQVLGRAIKLAARIIEIFSYFLSFPPIFGPTEAVWVTGSTRAVLSRLHLTATASNGHSLSVCRRRKLAVIPAPFVGIDFRNAECAPVFSQTKRFGTNSGVIVNSALEAKPVAFVIGQVAATLEANAQSVQVHAASRRGRSGVLN